MITKQAETHHPCRGSAKKGRRPPDPRAAQDMMKTIYLSEYGITPGTDFLPALTQLFQEYAEDCEFVFAPGDYRLTGREQRTLALSNTDVIHGAEDTAICYSIVETAKANGLNPEKYFAKLLTTIPEHMDDKDTSFLDELLP